MLIALILRLLAAVYSKGFAFYDDHFLIIEAVQNWLYQSEPWYTHIGHRYFYQLFHYIFFYFCDLFLIQDAQFKMLIIRLIHAIYSTLLVYYGYKLTELISSKVMAKKVGLALAVFWFFPFLSVRNLAEFVCTVPLIAGYYYFYRNSAKTDLYLGGALFAISFIFRYQLFFLLIALLIVLIIQKKYKVILPIVISFSFVVLLLHGVVEWIFNGIPFESFLNILSTYNNETYIIGPWYRYSLFLIGILIPPFSLIMIVVYFRSYKKFAILFWPSLFFIIMHSIIPGKQERFILPIVPIIIVLVTIGFEQLWSEKIRKRVSYSFLGLNTVLLLILTFTYSKKTRVESMTLLSKKSDLVGIILENGGPDLPRPPLFYLESFSIPVMDYNQNTNINIEKANYIVFYGNRNIEKRKSNFKDLHSVELSFDSEIKPSLIDDIAYRMNPKRNLNKVSYIYRIKRL